MSSLVILAASVFEIWCGKTDRQTNAAKNPTVGVGNNKYKVSPERDVTLLARHAAVEL